MNPHYIAALQAAAYQTAALYGAAAAVPGYDHEALYRLQLARYAAVTGLAIPGGPSLGAHSSSQVTSLLPAYSGKFVKTHNFANLKFN